jgi:hypothetical protein
MTPTNPFKPATPTHLYLKLGVYGDTGTGKTVLALSADELGKVCVVDAEGGTTAYRGVYNFDVINSQSYMELTKALTYLESGGHEYKTIVYDPATILYEAIQEARAKFRGKSGGEGDAGKLDISDWGAIKKIYKSLMIRLANLPLNVVLTFREKDKTDFKDINKPVYLGPVFDGEKSTPYYLDLWGRMIVTDKGVRVLEVKKSRFPELSDKKIAIPMKGGFKKLWDLCELSRKNEGAKGKVQYTVDATDEDVEPLRKPEPEPPKAVDAPKPPTQVEAEAKAVEVVESKVADTPAPKELDFAPPSDDTLHRRAVKAQLESLFSDKKEEISNLYEEWCGTRGVEMPAKASELDDMNYIAFAEYAIKNRSDKPEPYASKPARPPRVPKSKGVLREAVGTEEEKPTTSEMEMYS